MADSRRIREGRQTRDLYTRVPDSNLRVNAPDGFLHDFYPIPWDGDATEPGAWWAGSDNPYYQGPGGPMVGPIGPNGPGWDRYTPTTGSPLTRPSQQIQPLGPGHLLPAVTRCLQVIVESVVRTLWLYRDSKGNVSPRPLWVDDPMLLGSAPGPIFPLQPRGKRFGGHTFYTTLLADAILWGQGGFVCQLNADGQPVPGTLILLNPFMFNVDDAGYIVLDPWGENPLRTDWNGDFEMRGQPWRVARLPGLYPAHDGWPQGVLLRHWDTFHIGAKLGRYLGDFYSTGIPSGYLSVSTPNFGVEVPDPDRPGQMVFEQDLLKRNWMKAHGRGKRSVAVLNSTVTYTPVSVNPVDAEAARMSEVNLRDVAHAFGMSAIWLDIGVGGMSYSNSSERRADLVSMTSAGWGEKMMDLVNSLLPYGTRAEINWPSFVSPSTETLAPAMVALVQAGILSATEARQYLGVQPWLGPDPRFVDTSKAAGHAEPSGEPDVPPADPAQSSVPTEEAP